jgi:phage I-like protein
MKRAIMLSVDGMPSEFRIFQRGINETSKGNFLFDDKAAKLVMTAYRKHGVDLMIDLEHLSLDEESRAFDPDARGWCQLEVRKDGSLWAVNVRWTPDGERRLRNRLQRYVSPTFLADEKSRRISAIFNIAICATPATHNTPALVAASKRSGKTVRALTLEVTKMDPIMQKLAALLGLGDGATAEDVIAAVQALQDAVNAAKGGADDSGDDEGEGEEMSHAASDEIDPDDLEGLKPETQAKILRMSAQHTKLASRVGQLEERTTNRERDALISANADKLTPKLEKWARKQTVETLSEFFADAPKVVRTERTREPDKRGVEVKLTAAHLAVARATGVKPEAILERLKKEAEEKALKEAAIHG